MKRGVAIVVLMIDVGTSIQQHLHDALVDLLCTKYEQGVSMLVGSIDRKPKI